MKVLVYLAFCATIATACSSVAATTRHYEAHCRAPDGSLFVLRAKYDYSPFAIGPFSPVSKVEPWKISYQHAKQGSKSHAPQTLRFSGINHINCKGIGKLEGYPVVERSFMYPNGTWFDPRSVPGTVVLSIAPEGRAQAARTALEEHGVEPWDFSIVLPRAGRLVHEQALIGVAPPTGGHIRAVYKSTSTDNGRTWTEARVTREAEIFELGKTLDDQRYAARLAGGGNVSRPANRDQRR